MGMAKDTRVTRREALGLGAGSAVFAALGGLNGAALHRLLELLRQRAAPAEPAAPVDPVDAELAVRGRSPAELEGTLDGLATLVTPTRLFFVRTHDDPPVVDPARWRLEVTGAVARPLSLSLEDLRQRPQMLRLAVLQCAGNGRAFHAPRVPGAQWQKGACGQAWWAGPSLAALLDEADAAPDAAFVNLAGADRMAMPKAPAYVRSIPLDRARHETSIVAVEMNGDPLPPLHGGPARLCLPGWTGQNWMKWITRIEVAREPLKDFYAATAYRIPTSPIEPGAAPAATMPVTENVVKSIIARPADGAVLEAGRGQLVVGVAFSGLTSVAGVDVSTDGGKTWQPALLEGDETPGAWKVFRLPFRPTQAGPVTILSRATDALGRTQPDASPWNPGGYLWNAVDRVTCEARL